MLIHEPDYKWAHPLNPRRETEFLVLHQSASEGGSAEDLHRAQLVRGRGGIGWHFYIRRDGSVWRGRPEACVGEHSAALNSRSLGLCFEGDFESADMPEAQLLAGRELIALLLSRYPGAQVLPQSEPGDRGCPGSAFPLRCLIF